MNVFRLALVLALTLGLLVSCDNQAQVDHPHDTPGHESHEKSAHHDDVHKEEDSHGHGSHDDHSDMWHGHGHAHDPIEIGADEPIPSLEIAGHIDQMWGVNLQIKTTNFELSWSQVNERHNPGYGHAHVYIDGVKIGRVYSEWFHLDGKLFTPGSHELRVTLNANDHSELLLGGEPIEDSVEVIIE